MRALSLIAVLGLLAALGASPAHAAAPAFGIESFQSSFAEPPFSEAGPESFLEHSEPIVFEGPFLDRGGVPVTQAGAHPFAFTATFVFNHSVEKEGVLDTGGTPEEKVPTEVLVGGDPKNVAVNLPAGMGADPQAVPQCEEASLDGGSCPTASQIGLIAVYLDEFPTRIIAPLYNMTPAAGMIARFGANPAGLGFVVNVDGRLQAVRGDEGGYAVSAEVTNISGAYPIYGVAITLWGDPSDPAHDAERGSCSSQPPYSKGEGNGVSCPLQPSEVSDTAFLSMPTSCSGEPLVSSIAVESSKEPGVPLLAESSSPALTGCNGVAFKPEIEVTPETATADTPTGLRVDLHVPQNELVGGTATANLKNAVLTLPEGMTVNPSAADGLAGCSPEEIALSSPEVLNPETGESEITICPRASKIGSVEVRTPLLEKPLPGSIYLGTPYENPFGSPEHPGGSLLAVYVVVEDRERGVIIKLAGHVEANAQTGRLTVTLQDSPQLPIEDFELDFFGGPRGLLVTPPACGMATTSAELTPWSREAAATPSSGFQVEQDCGQGLNPGLLSGSVNVLAGAFTSFTMQLARQDSEQDIGALSFTTPPGLLANLASVSLCPEPQAQRGECGPASEIGMARIAAGAGSDPIYLSAHVYLTSSYNGAPFGLSIAVPVIAGPFDLGVVHVRASVAVNPRTAALTIATTPLPQIVDGIPLHIEHVNVTIDRPGFMLNPTSCEPASVTATVQGAQGAVANVSSPFHVGGCSSLKFSPTFKVSTAARTSRADGASLNATLTYPSGIETHPPADANLRYVKLELPRALASRLTTLQTACLARSFEADPASCPPESAIGTAKVVTPILPVALEGPVYFVSHGSAGFPSIQIVLQGDGVEIVLSGETSISAQGVTSTTFPALPDQPVSSFELRLPEGPYSALGTHKNLCALTRTVTIKKRVREKVRGRTRTVVEQVKARVPEALVMPTTLVGQNGAGVSQETRVTVVGCPQVAKRSDPKRAGGRKRTRRK